MIEWKITMLKKIGYVLSNVLLCLLYVLPVFLALFGTGLVSLLVLGWFEDNNILLLFLIQTSVFLFNSRYIYNQVVKFAPKPTTLFYLIILGVGLWGWWNVNHTAQHVFSDRDPATYLLTAAYFQDSNDLTFNIPSVVQNIDGVTGESSGFTYQSDSQDELVGQGMHMLPALGAVSGKILGELRMNSINVLIGVVALLAFFAFSRIYIHDKWALVATVVLGVSLPFIYFSRDFYSEILSITILFAFLSSSHFAHKSKNLVLWVIAGICLGSLVLVRIDGFLVMASVFFVTLTSTVQTRKRDKRYARSIVLIVVPVALLIASIGLFDMFVFNPNYFSGESRDKLITYQFALVAISLVAGFLFSHLGRFKKFYDHIESPHFRRVIIALLSSAFIGILTRPIWYVAYGTKDNKFVEAIQKAREHTIEPSRLYYEYSAEWMGWYVGTPIVYIGLFVAIWLFATYFRKGFIDKFPLIVFCMIILLSAGVYMIHPSVSPDQIWAVRRFLPVVIPGLIFCCMYALQYIEQQLVHKVRAQVIFLFGTALAIIPSLLISAPFFTVGEYQRMAGFSKVCMVIPEDGVVLWLSQSGSELLMATNTYCDVPAVTFADKSILEVPTREEFQKVQNVLSKRGKQLYVGYYDSFYGKLAKDVKEENAQTVSDYRYNELERTLYGPPRYSHEREQKIFIGLINSDGAFTNQE